MFGNSFCILTFVEDASYPVSQFHDTEVYMPGDVTFPLASAAEAALK